jgi:hypothetical protein
MYIYSNHAAPPGLNCPMRRRFGLRHRRASKGTKRCAADMGHCILLGCPAIRSTACQFRCSGLVWTRQGRTKARKPGSETRKDESLLLDGFLGRMTICFTCAISLSLAIYCDTEPFTECLDWEEVITSSLKWGGHTLSLSRATARIMHVAGRS